MQQPCAKSTPHSHQLASSLALPPGAAQGGGASSASISEQQLRVFQHLSASLTSPFPSLVETVVQLVCVKHNFCQTSLLLSVVQGSFQHFVYALHFKSLFFKKLEKAAQEVKAGPRWARDGKKKETQQSESCALPEKVISCDRGCAYRAFNLNIPKERYQSGIFPARGTIYNCS